MSQQFCTRNCVSLARFCICVWNNTTLVND